jgi:hypothetical protein
MRDKHDKELRLLTREPEAAPEPADAPLAMDAAESRWDPWLAALARLELEAEDRAN